MKSIIISLFVIINITTLACDYNEAQFFGEITDYTKSPLTEACVMEISLGAVQNNRDCSIDSMISGGAVKVVDATCRFENRSDDQISGYIVEVDNILIFD